MNKKIIFILLITITFNACKTVKKTTTNNSTNLLMSKVITNYNTNSFNKKTLKASVKVKYEGKTSLPSVNVSLRIEKDKVIWMSISKSIFSLGKLKITPNKVQFYNKLQHEYFDGDFTLLSNFLGTEVNFKQVQQILLGEAVFNLNENEYQIETLINEYAFTPKKANKLFDILFILNATNFKINRQEINQEKEGKHLAITYQDYENIDDVNFPKAIYVVAKDKKNTNTINITYKNVVFNMPLNFPFSIPSGYKEMKLK